MKKDVFKLIETSKQAKSFLVFDTYNLVAWLFVWPMMLFIGFGFWSELNSISDLSVLWILMAVIPWIWTGIGVVGNYKWFYGKHSTAIRYFRVRELLGILFIVLLVCDLIRGGWDMSAWTFNLLIIAVIGIYYLFLDKAFIHYHLLD